MDEKSDDLGVKSLDTSRKRAMIAQIEARTGCSREDQPRQDFLLRACPFDEDVAMLPKGTLKTIKPDDPRAVAAKKAFADDLSPELVQEFVSREDWRKRSRNASYVIAQIAKKPTPRR